MTTPESPDTINDSGQARMTRFVEKSRIIIAHVLFRTAIGEWVGASAGLGYLMTYSQPLFLTARVFASIFILSVMVLVYFH